MHNEGPFSSYGSEGMTVMFPGTIGGGNWGGMALNPQLGYLFVNISNLGTIGKLVPTSPNSRRPAPPGLPPLPDVDYLNNVAYTRFQDKNGLPCQQPPWGELAAINVNTGDVAWKVPFGVVDALEEKGIKNTGTPNIGGPIATSTGLVFIGATRDKRFRAFDAKTGKVLWEAKLEAAAAATPITYRGKDGKQYVVIAAGGPSDAGRGTEFEGNFSQKLVAFALP
jgi:quinoprotein glucose dehydrogenase